MTNPCYSVKPKDNELLFYTNSKDIYYRVYNLMFFGYRYDPEVFERPIEIKCAIDFIQKGKLIKDFVILTGYHKITTIESIECFSSSCGDWVSENVSFLEEIDHVVYIKLIIKNIKVKI